MCVLYMLYEKGAPCRVCDICSEGGISKQTVNSALRRLENEGAIYLEPDEGKRKRVCLTQKGRELTAQTAARIFEAECTVFGGWPDEEYEQYLRLMKKYVDDFRVEIEKTEGEMR